MHHVQRLQRRNATELLHFFAAGDGSLAVQHASVSSASYCQQILDALHAVHGRGGEPSTSGCESDERSSPQFWSPRISTFWSARKNALSPQRSRAPTYSQYLRRQLHALHYHVPSWTASVGPGKVAWLDAAFSNPFLLSEISAGIFKPARRQLVGCVQLATPHGSPLLVHRPYCQIADRSTGGLRALRAAPVRKPFSVGGREAAQAGGSGSAAGAGVDGNGRGSAATAAPGSDAGGSAAAAASGDGGGGSAGSSNVRQLATQRHVLRSGPSVQNVCVQEILGRAKMNTVFEVIVIRSDGRTLEPNGGVTASELGLHSRDLSLFARDSRLSPQRATIAVRGDRILFRTEAIKAVIERDQCTLIKNT
ncbi:hypothetical protein VOLCADRAFT_118703 [Volvox carteri f. nagariensis]|uniref:Uncharacterized protein n=1 Tax=Volvox carteri f. nagariensis TaxID=3068 RepID=D8U6S2_VOLCA|nr:uncharacterized protein VOLCADRAFT_118703 [Volvox carteri f. nagariensis]EFJ44560.1 hypothetical protein VOLCADRAFT_118703 [Volvox carteri f. nagariensis]|eukprot:XP_002954410.1 hypothetical protein VOLCADRAFT_118703 [Volvox carteri f. nagariensis]